MRPEDVAPVQARVVFLPVGLQSSLRRIDARIAPRGVQFSAVRRLQDRVAARREHARDFAHRPRVVVHVFEHVVGDHQVEGPFRERHGFDIDLRHVGCRREQVATHVFGGVRRGDLRPQAPLGREMQYARALDALEQARRAHVQQQVALAVVGAAARYSKWSTSLPTPSSARIGGTPGDPSR